MHCPSICQQNCVLPYGANVFQTITSILSFESKKKAEIQILFKATQNLKENKYTDITKMLDFLIGNIFVQFDEQVFQQTIGIPMGNCVHRRKTLTPNIYFQLYI